MFVRSVGRAPVTVLMRITIPKPSGYCGATSPIDQIGSTHMPNRSTDEIATSILASFDTVFSAFATSSARLTEPSLGLPVLGCLFGDRQPSRPPRDGSHKPATVSRADDNRSDDRISGARDSSSGSARRAPTV